MELDKITPTRLNQEQLESELQKIANIIERMADPDIFVWLGRKELPTDLEIHRAATIVADRLCGSVANPIIRNAQEKRQLTAIESWLIRRGYKPTQLGSRVKFNAMLPGTFSFRLNVPIKLVGGVAEVNIPIDAVIMPKMAKTGDLPIFLEAKSAGDFANVNKRRKEEAVKMVQLRNTYGSGIQFNLF